MYVNVRTCFYFYTKCCYFFFPIYSNIFLFFPAIQIRDSLVFQKWLLVGGFPHYTHFISTPCQLWLQIFFKDHISLFFQLDFLIYSFCHLFSLCFILSFFFFDNSFPFLRPTVKNVHIL